MASQYFTILTDYGTTAFANALSRNQPLQLTTFAVGDGNGQAVTPTANRTALAREKHRAAVSAISLDPRNNKQVIVELTIPENVGGFYIREMGVFDNQNKLVAYANCPESFKPTESSGSGKVQVLRMILKVSSSSAVTLTVDHSVIFVTRQQLSPKTITSSTQNGFDESGHTHEIAQATTTQAGIVRLLSAITSTSETHAATPKAVKTVKDQLDSVSRNLANYIPNSKKSSSVSSSSGDTVATSAAVKTAYDKGVEAKNAADNANNNANGRVSKASDAMTGNLIIDSQNQAWSAVLLKNKQDKYLVYEVNPDNEPSFGSMIYRNHTGQNLFQLSLPKRTGEVALREDVETKVSKYGDTMSGNLIIDSQNQAWSALLLKNKQGKSLVYEVNPDSESSFGSMIYCNQAGQHLFKLSIPKRTGEIALLDDVNRRVHKDGDEIKALTIKREFAGLNITSTANEVTYLDFRAWNGAAPQSTIQTVDIGGFATEFRFFNTPNGDNYDSDRRQHVMTINPQGAIWAKPYGWLHDYFIRREDFIRTLYPQHYAGAEVYKIRHLGLMITVMNTTAANGDFWLPESYDGFAICLAQDRGDGRVNLNGSRFLGGNHIYLAGRSDTFCHVLVIGFKNV